MGKDETEIIKAVQAGQKEEFRELVSQYKNLVYALIMRQVRHHESAEDLTQEVFIKAFKEINRFRFEAKFSTWLTRIAINHMNTFFTSKAYRKVKVTSAYDFETPSSTPDLEQHTILKQSLGALHNCLAKIKDKFRSVLTLSIFEGLSYEQAAETLQVPVGTVRSRLNMARLLLIECMGEHL
jgi:RNA polymerase sigma-70 factor (ECF subfamily)